MAGTADMARSDDVARTAGVEGHWCADVSRLIIFPATFLLLSSFGALLSWPLLSATAHEGC